MLITEDVKKIQNMAGRELDRALAEALGLSCPEGCKSFKDCDHAPYYSTHYYAAWVLRMEMEKRGWESDDRLSWMGWGDEDKHPWGYHVWFKRWIKHVDYCVDSGIHDPEKMPLAVSRCALLALTEPETGMGGSALTILKLIEERKQKQRV